MGVDCARRPEQCLRSDGREAPPMLQIAAINDGVLAARSDSDDLQSGLVRKAISNERGKAGRCRKTPNPTRSLSATTR